MRLIKMSAITAYIVKSRDTNEYQGFLGLVEDLRAIKFYDFKTAERVSKIAERKHNTPFEVIPIITLDENWQIEPFQNFRWKH